MTGYRVFEAVALVAIFVLGVGALPILADPGELSADEESLFFDDIASVHTASKYEQKVTEAPSAVSIVTAEEIYKCGATR